MNPPEDDKLREAGWRRPLTPEEEARLEAWLALHPEARPQWELETELSRRLQNLPDVPVSSNFTAQVMAALDREERREASAAGNASFARGLRWLRRWLWSPGPRVAWALVLVLAVGAGYHRRQVSQRHDMASGLCALANVTTLSGTGLLEDFEAIQRFSQSAPDEDEELFITLSQ